MQISTLFQRINRGGGVRRIDENLKEFLQKSLSLQSHSSHENTLLFFATATLKWTDIQEILSKILLEIGGNNVNLLGAVVDEIHTSKHAWSLSRISASTSDHASRIIPFYSPPGLARRAKSVGRWHDLQKQPTSKAASFLSSSSSKVRSSMVGFQSVSLPADLNSQHEIIPKELLNLDTAGNGDNYSFISVTDGEPFDYYNYLESKFPSSQKMGLFAAQTPFLNGRPYTLFVNEKIYSGGSIGLAVCSPQTPSISLDFSSTSLYPISPAPQEITKCRGNIVLQVAGEATNPSSILVDQVHKSLEVQKDKDENTKIYAKLVHGDKSAILPVVGGDLSKGALAIDTLMDIEPKSTIEFLRCFSSAHHSGDASSLTADASVNTISSTATGPTTQETILSFSSLDVQESITETSAKGDTSEEEIMNGHLVLSSEKGIVAGLPSTILGGYQISTIPQSTVSMTQSSI